MLDGRKDARDSQPADPPLFVQRHPVRSAAASSITTSRKIDSGTHEVLSVACPVRVADVPHVNPTKDAFQAQLLARLGRLIPYLSDHVVDVSQSLDTQSWDEQPTESGNPHSWWSVHPLFETADAPLFGVFARPVQTHFHNMAHCGRDVAPAFGLEGEYIAAWAAVATLQKQAGRHWT